MSRYKTFNNKGGVLIEFVIFLPVILTLISGIINVAIGLNEHTTQLSVGRAVARTVSRTIAEKQITQENDIKSLVESTSDLLLRENRFNPDNFEKNFLIRKISDETGFESYGYLLGVSIKRKPEGLLSFLRNFTIASCTAISFRIESNTGFPSDIGLEELCKE